MDPAWYSYLPPSIPRVSLLDVFIANDELAMVRYRLRLHAPFATRTIIAESRLTHTGETKPLYVSEGPEQLRREELARYNVRLLEITYTPFELHKSNVRPRGRFTTRHAIHIAPHRSARIRVAHSRTVFHARVSQRARKAPANGD